MRITSYLMLLAWMPFGPPAAAADSSTTSVLWRELATKRAKIPGVLRQEFVYSRAINLPNSTPRTVEAGMIVELAGERWREASEGLIRFFDGAELFTMEQGGDEFTRTKVKMGSPGKRPEPASLPRVYLAGTPDWTKAQETARRPCGLTGVHHECVVLEAPLTRWSRLGNNRSLTQRTGGTVRIIADLTNGMVLIVRISETIQTPDYSYGVERSYSLKSFEFTAGASLSLIGGTPTEPGSLQQPVPGLREVKTLTPWNAARMRKQLVGKPAPDMEVTDIDGRKLRLSGLKGRTVLLDFFTTWCPPCRADAPSLEKLHQQFGAKELALISLSVQEERGVVKKFLEQYPRTYPVVLTNENDLAPPYRVDVFPTYIVIDKNGQFAAAMEGDQGFSDLKQTLRKAGMDITPQSQ